METDGTDDHEQSNDEVQDITDELDNGEISEDKRS